MKAIIKPSAGPGLELTDVATPKHGPTTFCIEVQQASICGPTYTLKLG